MIEIPCKHALHFVVSRILQPEEDQRVLLVPREGELRIAHGIAAHRQSCHGGRHAKYSQRCQSQPQPPSDARLDCRLLAYARHYWLSFRRASSLSPACQTLPAPSVITTSPSCATPRSASM